MMKDITGHNGLYKIDESGKVFSVRRNKYMFIKISKITGYAITGLTNIAGKRSYPLIHRLVAIAFIPNPQNKREVNHKDGNKAKK